MQLKKRELIKTLWNPTKETTNLLFVEWIKDNWTINTLGFIIE